MVTIKSNTLSQLLFLKSYIMVTKVANNHSVVHGLNYKANMLTGFSSNPHTCVLLEVTFLANQINVCCDKASFIRHPLLCDSLTCEAERLRLFFCSYLCSPQIFVSAERGQKCKDPRNHLSARFHTRRSLFGDTVCCDWSWNDFIYHGQK